MADLDPDFAALMGAQKAQDTAAMTHMVAGGSGLPAPNDPTNGMGYGARALASVGQGMVNLGRHAGNLVGLESDQDLKDAKAIDAPLMARPGADLYSALGQTAAMAPLSMGVGGALARVAPTLAASPIATGAIQGAVQGGITADPGQRMQGMALGGAAGGGLPALGKVGSTLVSGLSRTPSAQTLLNAGVSLTPGQMNPTGVANRMEQALEGAFGVGDLVQNARDAGMKQYTRAMVERSMAPGATLPKGDMSFNDMIEAAGKSFDTAYDVGKGYPVGAKIMSQTGPDIPLTQALKTVTARARPGMSSQDQASIGRNLQDLLSQQIKDARQSGNGLQSEDLLAFRSTIRDMIRGEDGLTNASRATKKLYQDAADKVTDAINSQIPKDAAQAIQAADAQYGKFKIVQDAAASAKDKPGGPTPFQISTAIAKATPKSVYAAGGGANRDLSQAAAETFQNNVPRTGLAGVGRLALPMAVAGGAGMSHPLIAGPALAGLGALTLTSGGRALAAGQTGLQKALASKFGALNNLIPAPARNVAALYGRGTLGGLLAPRLQQMPSDATGQ